MNKKFLSAILFGALMVTSTGTFVSCKDYDDDIKDLQGQVDANKKQIEEILAAIQSNKYIVSYTPITNGYELTLSNGEKLVIKNGEKGDKGEQGEQGIQGIQGIPGVPGESPAAVIPQFRANGGFWQVSVDEGATWSDVLDTEGAKVPTTGAPGEAGGNNVTIDPATGFIKIGDVTTTLKYNATIPSIVYDEETKTMTVAIDGQSYTLMLEGSTYNGLQSVVYRRQAWNDLRDSVLSASLAAPIKNAEGELVEDSLIASAPGTVSFKVYPTEFNVDAATYTFFDTHKTRSAVADPLSYVDKSAKLENGILTVQFKPTGLALDTRYASSMNVTLNNKTACSDYFNVKLSKFKVGDAEIFVQSCDKPVSANQVAGMIGATQSLTEGVNHYKFVYTESYNVNDSIAYGFKVEEDDYQSFQELGFGESLVTTYAQTEGKENGIFKLDPATGIITVDAKNQSSAINEFCYVTVTYQVMNGTDKVGEAIEKDLAIQAVLPEDVPAEIVGKEIIPMAGQSLNLTYSIEKQIVKLDVRDFEEKLGGRNFINADNKKSNSKVWALGYTNKNNNFEILNAPATLPNVSGAPNSDEVTIGEREVIVYFKAGENTTTSLDSLFLIVGAKAQVAENTLYLAINGKKVVLNNKNFYLNKVSVVRNASVIPYPAIVDEATGAAKVKGEWNGEKDFAMATNLNQIYKVTPSDLLVDFILAPKDEQPEAVQAIYELLSVKVDGKGVYNQFSAVPTDDKAIDVEAIKAAGGVKLIAYDHADEAVNNGTLVDKEATPLATGLKLIFISPVQSKITVTDYAKGKTAFDAPVYNETATIDVAATLNAVLKDKYETTKPDNKVIVNKDGVVSGYENADTYGAEAFTYAISNQAEIDNLIGANTISIDATTGEITVVEGTLAWTVNVKVKVSCAHSWGTSNSDERVFKVTRGE